MRRVIVSILIALASVGVLAVSGVGIALALENQDAFCASCHTEPETTYFQRAIQSNGSDLASYHTHKATDCIDCHSGAGALGRADGLKQGARDLANYLVGKYHSPAITLSPLGDASCIKCHSDIFIRPPGRTRAGLGHYHYFLPQWQQSDSQAAQCVSCHVPHTVVSENLTFMIPGQVGKLCDGCHEALSGVVK